MSKQYQILFALGHISFSLPLALESNNLVRISRIIISYLHMYYQSGMLAGEEVSHGLERTDPCHLLQTQCHLVLTLPHHPMMFCLKY